MIGSLKRGSQGKGQRMDLNLTSLTCRWLAASVILRFNLTVTEYCSGHVGNSLRGPSHWPCSFRRNLCLTPVVVQLSPVPISFRQWIQLDQCWGHVTAVVSLFLVSHIWSHSCWDTQQYTISYIITQCHNSLWSLPIHDLIKDFCRMYFQWKSSALYLPSTATLSALWGCNSGTEVIWIKC